MIITAIALFSLAAMIGMVLLSFVLKGEKPSQALVLTHGPLASGGIILVLHDMIGKAIPKWPGVLHGLIAVAGFVCLLVFTV